ncbi:helix-turn-helix domain-containing protein [Flammeovirga yaeyamensis]|uniref:Helix-turn-helix domain-containing protein n=1 Tax=Flammeovirga yaeyamensis TaxID=367791 RepID=A0AAX1NCN0_9BACT|nr:AraC family transcriptional regulator [Flammeovirga yaeyamensis]MBB3699437.1 AraC-like DNA-binding protein [Flammeovirga yaeyamensis]NMF35306.1 helix-turn-helix transcriptional regulator [Flammeovirga yaeyamensis]QWG04166.1 helix-turn-helix domain-containing protein [Flammeovirga yaeyamensis]
MNRHNLDGHYTDEAFREYFNLFDETEIKGNHYWGKSDDGVFNYWLFDEFDHYISSVLYDIEIEKPIVFEDIQNDDNGYLLVFLLDSSVNYKDKKIGSGYVEGAAIFNAHRRTIVKCDPGQKIKGITVHLSEKLLQNTGRENYDELNDLLKNNSNWVFFEHITYEMEQCIRELFALQSERIGKYGFSSAKILELITHFFTQFYTHRTGQKKFDLTQKETEDIFNIKTILVSDLMYPPTIESLSQELGVSIPKLRKDFKNVFGLSPHQFIIRERLHEARRKVIQTKESMTEISDLLGFTDSSHFTKLYKKEFGITPLTERKQKHS